MGTAPWTTPQDEPAPWDNPVVPKSSPSTLNPLPLTLDQTTDSWKSGVYSKMIGVTPEYAYPNVDEIEKQLRDRDAEFDKGYTYAAETGLEETPIGMLMRGRAPDPFESSSALERFVHNAVSFITDPVVMVPTIAGAFADTVIPGAAPAGFIGGSAIDAGLRQTLMDHYQKGDIKSFGDLTDRAGDALWAATKGALTAETFDIAGSLPVPGMLAEKPLAGMAIKGAYQAAAVTTAGSLLDGRVPRLRDFEDTALQVIPLNLVTGGSMLGRGEIKQATMDVYAEDGTTPQDTADKLAAQPPVKPDLPDGLRPAISFRGSLGAFFDASREETHADVAERVLGQKPVTMEALEDDPKLADSVLQMPEIQEQPVIDRAWALKKEAIDSGDVPRGTQEQSIDDLYDRRQMQSGRGFVTPDGKFLNRTAAKAWSKVNEPSVYDMWTGIAKSEKAEFHSQDYMDARERVQNRNLAQGEPDYKAQSPFWQRLLGAARKDLNDIKAGKTGDGYMKSVLRTLLVGQRDTRIAATTQLHDALAKMLPDSVDQEALTFMRDFKDAPLALQDETEKIRNGDNGKLKKLLPAMERAQNPTPQMLAANQQLTQYFASALKELQDLGLIERGIPADRYITHILKRVTEEGEEGRVGPFTKTRKYETIIDALKTGHIEAQTVNALDALSLYGDRYGRLVANKLLGDELKNTKLGELGSQEKHPIGWKQLANRRGLAGIWVPPDVADAMHPVFENNALSTIPGIAKFLHVQSLTKGIELGLSVFHMKALSITAFNNMELRQFVSALKSDTKAPEFEQWERQGAAVGLKTTKTGTPYEAWESIKPSSLSKKTLVDWARGVPGLKQIDGLAHALTNETFDVIQRKFKVTDYALKTAKWIAKHPKASDQELFAAQRGIAKEVNAAYGGLNWEVMGWGKNAIALTRMIMLAPDWTFSNVLNAKYFFEGGPAGAAARMFWVKSFATGFSATAAMSIMVGGKYDTNHPMQVYLGTDKDGKEMYANWFFAGAPKDMGTLVTRVRKDGPLEGIAGFMAYKLGPVGSLMKGLSTNREFSGRAISKPSDSFGKKTLDQTEFAAEKLVPITGTNLTDTFKRMLTDPDMNYTYKDYLEVAGDLVGVTTVHQEEKGDGVKRTLPGETRKRTKKFSIRGARR